MPKLFLSVPYGYILHYNIFCLRSWTYFAIDGQSAHLSSMGHSLVSYDQILITVGYLWFSSYGAPSLTGGRVCNLLVQLLLGLASAVAPGTKSRRTRNWVPLSTPPAGILTRSHMWWLSRNHWLLVVSSLCNSQVRTPYSRSLHSSSVVVIMQTSIGIRANSCGPFIS
jgi:hypothetical protein